MLELYEEKALDRIAERLLSRIIPALEKGGNGKSYPKLLTVAQAAHHLGRTCNSVRHMIHRGEIPVVRHGRSVRLDRDQLQKWIQEDSI